MLHGRMYRRKCYNINAGSVRDQKRIRVRYRRAIYTSNAEEHFPKKQICLVRAFSDSHSKESARTYVSILIASTTISRMLRSTHSLQCSWRSRNREKRLKDVGCARASCIHRVDSGPKWQMVTGGQRPAEGRAPCAKRDQTDEKEVIGS